MAEQTIRYDCPKHCGWWATLDVQRGCRPARCAEPDAAAVVLVVPTVVEAHRRLDNAWRRHWSEDHAPLPAPHITTTYPDGSATLHTPSLGTVDL